MYSRYMAGSLPEQPEADASPASGQGDPVQETPLPFRDTAEEAAEQSDDRSAKKGGLLQSLFGGNIKLPEMNADTVLLLVLVYFLVADESENISDTLLIIGVLLLLGF